MKTDWENLNVSSVLYNEEYELFLVQTNLGEIRISNPISLIGFSGDTEKKVNLELNPRDYLVFRLYNPYLNAQNDIYYLKGEQGETIGMVLPATSLLDDEDSS